MLLYTDMSLKEPIACCSCLLSLRLVFSFNKRVIQAKLLLHFKKLIALVQPQCAEPKAEGPEVRVKKKYFYS